MCADGTVFNDTVNTVAGLIDLSFKLATGPVIVSYQLIRSVKAKSLTNSMLSTVVFLLIVLHSTYCVILTDKALF